MMKRALSITALLAVVCAIAAGCWWWMTPKWPDFRAEAAAQSRSNEPQVIYRIKRDYAYRIGDLIEVELFVRHKPSVTVNTGGLAMTGDFEPAGKPSASKKTLDDRTVVHRILFYVQSFKAAPSLALEGTLSWTNGDQRLQLTLPTQTLYTSKTWDGREQIQEGDDPRAPLWWYGGRHAASLAAGSLAFLALCVVALRNLRRNRRGPSALDEQRRRVVAMIAQLRSGKGTQALHTELDALVRARYGLGTIPASQLKPEQVHDDLIEFLRINCPAVYSLEPLDDAARARLCELGDWLVKDWLKYADA